MANLAHTGGFLQRTLHIRHTLCLEHTNNGSYQSSQPSIPPLMTANLSSYISDELGTRTGQHPLQQPKLTYRLSQGEVLHTYAGQGNDNERLKDRIERQSDAPQATCDICGTHFHGEYARGNFQRHRRTMHFGTMYHCEARSCNKKFGRRDNRLKHYRKDHPEMNVPPAAVRKV
ncbi:hypothetical protein P171DRAFT_437736 [Karstenula rhodostoma CBS 690.94]|uniref:C2H2-type domain-containing protein n=1 Tax=Karstenula rhodostoma CBS 690.94 TaxID=1392251 RepID=A0A9P4P5M8_9PLEO|nr:hypothetical protein P171DRAFT_437736 [Karstenula rhodostoma CBS 690.94]